MTHLQALQQLEPFFEPEETAPACFLEIYYSVGSKLVELVLKVSNEEGIDEPSISYQQLDQMGRKIE